MQRMNSYGIVHSHYTKCIYAFLFAAMPVSSESKFALDANSFAAKVGSVEDSRVQHQGLHEGAPLTFAH